MITRPDASEAARQVTARRPPPSADRGAAAPGSTLWFAGRVVVATIVVAAVSATLWLIVYAADLLLLIFAGVLLAIPLRRFGRLLQQKTGMAPGVAVAIATLVLLTATLAIVVVAAGRVAVQANELATQLRIAFANLAVRLGDYAWAQEALARLPSGTDLLFGSGGVLSRLGGLASTTLGALVNVVVAIVVSVYVASQPHLYANGIRRLVPIGYRERTVEVMNVLDQALGRWLLGRLVLMVLNGGMTTIALWLLGVPLALTLGVIAGLLNFVPNFGPIIAAVPAVLIAWLDSGTLAAYTALVYLLVQMIDGYVLTPLADRRSVELPPVLTIAAQLLLGVMFGFVGLLLASPLTATILVLVKMVYVEDVLGDPVMRESVLSDEPATSDAASDRR